MPLNSESLDKSLSDLEHKTKKLNFCKAILKAKDPFSVKTDKVDKTVLEEISIFVKDKINEYAESVINDSIAEKHKKELTEEDWQILKGLIGQVKKKMPKPAEEPVKIVKNVEVVQPVIKKRKRDKPAGPGVMLPEKSATGGSEVEVNIIVSNHAIMETKNTFKSDIPLNETVKVLSDDGEYYRCLYVNGQSESGVTKDIIFKIPKEDVITI